MNTGYLRGYMNKSAAPLNPVQLTDEMRGNVKPRNAFKGKNSATDYMMSNAYGNTDPDARAAFLARVHPRHRERFANQWDQYAGQKARDRDASSLRRLANGRGTPQTRRGDILPTSASKARPVTPARPADDVTRGAQSVARRGTPAPAPPRTTTAGQGGATPRLANAPVAVDPKIGRNMVTLDQRYDDATQSATDSLRNARDMLDRSDARGAETRRLAESAGDSLTSAKGILDKYDDQGNLRPEYGEKLRREMLRETREKKKKRPAVTSEPPGLSPNMRRLRAWEAANRARSDEIDAGRAQWGVNQRGDRLRGDLLERQRAMVQERDKYLNPYKYHSDKNLFQRMQSLGGDGADAAQRAWSGVGSFVNNLTGNKPTALGWQGSPAHFQNQRWVDQARDAWRRFQKSSPNYQFKGNREARVRRRPPVTPPARTPPVGVAGRVEPETGSI